MQLFDTHTHFDVADFDHDRQHLAVQAKQVGVEALVLIGFVESRFDELIQTHQQLQCWENVPQSYLAPGLHPFYIEQHQQAHLQQLEQVLKQHDCVAIGEIGLDTFLKQHKQPELVAKQQHYFNAQLELAMHYQKPVLLHIRKAHAETFAILKAQKFKLGGIAHAFSGGIEEAKALIKMGFKIGVTGQITNPNAKKLHQVVQAIGAEHLVIETDCPDMTPLCCQTSIEHRTRNTPVNLPYVLDSLAQTLGQPQDQLAEQLWQNSLAALRLG
ncbi:MULTISPECIES: TatD family hydrolase [unclassified Acinetobacter]|uniref:TatD family hydrolase n=1 Tax=unclassified Acinetobacter TaxID=196816 RepID=UPI00244853AE|nr:MULTISPECIES: TatD family hydrolase [unclassified Acinetobacter]MDH0031545.1 TatD family hydrolase [Acinetobacter sp. GD04021]MDH0886888.1 TatD family hydrolase [Acinetobacter sp. GD03873]MDH1083299.1 TatD family hydrolase [Acinetobacter sp. GD03983]MDH2190204.1 TatD family hydrolase [Acinetobacter sp. GD03645]MDH2203317.1 TatD family hydrolase [Acinetobacter sp. GD03647]